MNTGYSNLEREYAGEFEDMELEDLELEDTEFKTSDEFEDSEAYTGFELEGLEEFKEPSELDQFEWETVARPARRSPPRSSRGAAVRFPSQRIDIKPAYTLHGFCFNESSLMERHIKTIQMIAMDVVRRAQGGRAIAIRLVGHTDSIGKPENNKKLGMLRAQEVGKKLRRFLSPLLNRLQRGGAKLGRISIVEQSVGEKQPTSQTSNRTEMGRAKNRRVQVFFVQAP